MLSTKNKTAIHLIAEAAFVQLNSIFIMAHLNLLKPRKHDLLLCRWSELG